MGWDGIEGGREGDWDVLLAAMSSFRAVLIRNNHLLFFFFFLIDYQRWFDGCALKVCPVKQNDKDLNARR